MHKWLPILLNAFDSVLLHYQTVKWLLIPVLQIRVRNGKLFLLFLNQNIYRGYLNGPLKWDGSFEDQNHTLYKLSIRETSQFLCYERLLNLTYVACKNAFFCKLQFWSHCYTVVSYQALFRLSVYKIPTVYFWVQKMCVLHDRRLWFPDYHLSM